MTSLTYVIRDELSTEKPCLGFPFAEPRVCQLHERPRQWTPSGPMQAVRRALVASTGEVTIRKMNVTGTIVYSRASLTLRALRLGPELTAYLS